MKNCFFLLVTLSFLISCNNSSDYKGKWRLDILKLSNNEIDYPTNIFIENDSIKFNYWAFDHWHKFPLKIEKKKLSFNNWSVNNNIIADTLFLLNSPYVKDENDSILKWWFGKSITEINLPKIKNSSFSTEKDKDHPINHVLFGKRLDNNEFSLQLNDKYAEMQDLGMFFFECRIPRSEEIVHFPESALYIDKTTPMKYLQDIFYNLSIVNQLKLSFVNNINLKFNDSLGLYYEYKKLSKKLPAFRSGVTYSTNTTNNPMQPPPPPPYSPMFDDENLESNFIVLKKDTLYHNDKIISSLELKSIVKPWIKNNNVVFSLYDLESTYGKFLEMTAIINSIYQDVRERTSKEKFNKSYKDLTREEVIEMKIKNPMRHIWSYSIPHYNLVVEQNNSFFGLKVNKKM